MSDPSNAMQAAIYAALTADAAVLAALGSADNVFDRVPDPPVFPQIRIGEQLCNGDDHGCGQAWELFETVHIFARSRAPRADVNTIAAAVRAVMVEGALSPAGFSIVEAQFENLRTMMERDGLTAHGVLTVRYLIDPDA